MSASEWHIKDEGFNKARNAFCAKKDGITPKEFVDRHLASVQRDLAALGLEPTELARSAYRRYVEDGVPLDLVLNYSPTISGERYYDADIGRWVAFMHGGFSVDGRALGVGLKAIDVQPFAEDEGYISTWTLLQGERDAAASRMQVVADESPTSAAERSPDVPTIAVATSPVAAEEPMHEEHEEKVEAIERPAVIDNYAQLGKEVGQSFILYSKGKPRMRVEIVGVENGVIKVRRYLSGGWLEQGIKQAEFVRAERR